MGLAGFRLFPTIYYHLPVPSIIMSKTRIVPQIAESHRGSKEGEVICEIDGWLLGDMQFAVLVQVLFGDAV